MPSERRQLIIGLPRTGKTTFLAALWHVVTSNEVGAPLSLMELFGDDEHLNTIRRQWLSCEQVERTKLTSEAVVTMRLHDAHSGDTTDVIFPDLSGETFRNQWEYRQWTVEYAKTVRGATGALLFVHPDRVNRQAAIVEANAAVAELSEVEEEEAGSPQESTTDALGLDTGTATVGIEAIDVGSTGGAVEWEPEHSATQTQLVELLQFIANEELLKYPFRIAVVVSAWDKLRNMNLMPDVWIRTELPLLHQFLCANRETFDHRIYGVSAQGGDLDKDVTMLSEFVRHSERIEVVGDNVDMHDLSGIVRWVMG